MTPHNLHIFNLVDPASSHMFVSVCLHSQQLSQSCCTHLITHPSHTRWLKARDVEMNASSVITILTHPDAPSNEDSGCKGSSGQGMENALDNSSMECETSQEQKGGHKRGTEEQQ